MHFRGNPSQSVIYGPQRVPEASSGSIGVQNHFPNKRCCFPISLVDICTDGAKIMGKTVDHLAQTQE